jgi:hypothetical protein
VRNIAKEMESIKGYKLIDPIDKLDEIAFKKASNEGKNLLEQLKLKGKFLKEEVLKLEETALQRSLKGEKIILLNSTHLGSSKIPHVYLKIFENGKVKIYDPTLSGNMKNLFGKTNVPTGNPMILKSNVTGLTHDVVIRHQRLFTPSEYEKILEDIKHWKPLNQ